MEMHLGEGEKKSTSDSGVLYWLHRLAPRPGCEVAAELHRSQDQSWPRTAGGQLGLS